MRALPIGTRIGAWVIIGRNGGRNVTCRCDCGTVRGVRVSNMTRGQSKSCGCGTQPSAPPSWVKPNTTFRELYASEYNTFAKMKSRCSNRHDKSFAYYGGRGIRVCAGWAASFLAFIGDMGARPSTSHSIDRIDNDGHYSCGKCEECVANGWPANCRWATMTQQVRNTRVTARVSANGKTVALRDLVEQTGADFERTRMRIRRGWAAEEAVTLPSGVRRSRA